MRIKDIQVTDVRLGKNWRVVSPIAEGNARTIENANLEEAKEDSAFTASDQVIYSGLVAFPSGRVKALLLFKDVGEVGYGGVYWEFVEGRWRLVGEEPDPNYELGGREFIAQPLFNDPSFNAPDHDYRADHRNGFLKHCHVL